MSLILGLLRSKFTIQNLGWIHWLLLLFLRQALNKELEGLVEQVQENALEFIPKKPIETRCCQLQFLKFKGQIWLILSCN